MMPSYYLHCIHRQHIYFRRRLPKTDRCVPRSFSPRTSIGQSLDYSILFPTDNFHRRNRPPRRSNLSEVRDNMFSVDAAVYVV